MKYIPILFSTQMVQAILNGTKKQTRRAVKSNKPETTALLVNLYYGCDYERCMKELINTAKVQIGDVFWVRETFEEYQCAYNYKSGKYGLLGEKWKPSIFMPKEACRIFLKVTNVRVERLRDISEHDAELEGVENFWKDDSGKVNAFRNYLATKKQLEVDSWAHVAEDSIDSFRSLWQSINGIDSWYENPFVWVYDFEMIEKPLNFI